MLEICEIHGPVTWIPTQLPSQGVQVTAVVRRSSEDSRSQASRNCLRRKSDPRLPTNSSDRDLRKSGHTRNTSSRIRTGQRRRKAPPPTPTRRPIILLAPSRRRDGVRFFVVYKVETSPVKHGGADQTAAAMAAQPDAEVSVAIIGAGISGLVLALALEERKISYRIYEQARGYSGLGAGLGFNPASLRALQACSPAAYEAYTKVRAPHHPTREDYYFAYTDGKESFEVTTNDGSGAVRRSAWIEKLAEIVPSNNVHFSRRFKCLTESEEGRLRLEFEDGTEEIADVVAGCDGIKSRVRPLVVGEEHPSAEPSFSHKVVYRTLMSRSDARKVMGSKLAESAHFRVGEGIGYVSYPITGAEVNSFGMFKHHAEPWPHFPSVTASTTKQALLQDVSDAYFKGLAESLSDELEMWAIYDNFDHPLPTYSKRCITLIGDSAHSMTPNLGAGAGVSIEDAVVLAELLSIVSGENKLKRSRKNLHRRLECALAAYSNSRMARTQWVVQTSRELGEMNTKRPLSGKDWSFEDYQQTTTESYETVWGGQIDEMVEQAKKQYEAQLREAAL